MIDSTLLYGIVSLGVGMVVLITKICFKSKCEDVNVCWGLIHIERNTTLEAEETKIEHTKSAPSPIRRDFSLRNMNSL